MPAWNADLYMQFGNERTQPAIDLVARININQPKRIIDLGCGPGNSTEILRRRWPQANIAGLDSSPEMIGAARQQYPDADWRVGDAATWQAAVPCDIVFSNAALQWMPSHGPLVRHLLDQVAPGGVLAFQIPTHINSPLHRFILEIADDPEWTERMSAARDALTIERPSFYYDALADKASRLDIWETEYCHVMQDHQAIIKWISSTGLRPFLAALDAEEEQRRFVELLEERVAQAYPRQKNGNVLFPFRRLFVVACR